MTSHPTVPLLVAAVLVVASAIAADPGRGNLSYQGRAASLPYAWLVRGPSDMEPGKTVRRLVLSSTDIGDAGRLAGHLAIDDTAAGGPRLHAEVDVPLLKAFTLAR